MGVDLVREEVLTGENRNVLDDQESVLIHTLLAAPADAVFGIFEDDTKL